MTGAPVPSLSSYGGLICSTTIGVPRVTMVLRERCFSCSVLRYGHRIDIVARPEEQPTDARHTADQARCRRLPHRAFSLACSAAVSAV